MRDAFPTVDNDPSLLGQQYRLSAADSSQSGQSQSSVHDDTSPEAMRDVFPAAEEDDPSILSRQRYRMSTADSSQLGQSRSSVRDDTSQGRMRDAFPAVDTSRGRMRDTFPAGDNPSVLGQDHSSKRMIGNALSMVSSPTTDSPSITDNSGSAGDSLIHGGNKKHPKKRCKKRWKKKNKRKKNNSVVSVERNSTRNGCVYNAKTEEHDDTSEEYLLQQNFGIDGDDFFVGMEDALQPLLEEEHCATDADDNALFTWHGVTAFDPLYVPPEKADDTDDSSSDESFLPGYNLSFGRVSNDERAGAVEQEPSFDSTVSKPKLEYEEIDIVIATESNAYRRKAMMVIECREGPLPKNDGLGPSKAPRINHAHMFPRCQKGQLCSFTV